MIRRLIPRLGLLPALAAAALLFAPVAVAARPPTLSERAAIAKALPAFLRNTPTECVWLDVRVSRVPKYALVSPRYLNAATPGSRCSRYASNGFYILKRVRPRWKIVYQGSDWPSCSLRIPRDLVRCSTHS